MKKENIFLVGVLALAGYLIWKNSKKITPQEPSPKSSEIVNVDVVETTKSEKLSANASVTQPQFANSVFRKDWVIENQNSPFN
jgi:cytoskeletal protein RodZ